MMNTMNTMNTMNMTNMTKNILLAGVGGQGLVLTTKLICYAAFNAGFDFKSNDVIGLSQRGGKVWGSVRIGTQVQSPNIPQGCADVLLGLEPLEGYRWSGMLKDGGMVILNTSQIPPVPVVFEKAEYPMNIEAELSQKYQVIAFDANEKGRQIGSPKVANTFLVGVLAKNLPEIDVIHWENAIRNNVPEKMIQLNLEAFKIGYTW